MEGALTKSPMPEVVGVKKLALLLQLEAPSTEAAIVILPPEEVKLILAPCKRSVSVNMVEVAFKPASNCVWKPG